MYKYIQINNEFYHSTDIINSETSIYKKRVDYIFISKDLYYHSSYIIPYSTSDHLPVIIDL